jgi:hypothetical protein
MVSPMLRRLLILSILLPAAAFGQQWKLIAPMHKARWSAATVFLNDGRILAGGGANEVGPEPTSETYDPSTDKWTVVGSLNTGRDHTPFTKLHDGRIFISGGYVDNTAATLSSAEIFDPVTNTWSYSTPLNQIREGHAEVTLGDGKVLIAAGVIGGTTTYPTSCEIFDPLTGTMSFTGSISQGRFGSVLFDSASGNALLICGHYNGVGGTWLTGTEEYNASSGSWSIVANSQASHDAFLTLPDGEIIAPSGSSGPIVAPLIGTQVTPLIEIYNPRSKAWRTIGNLPIPRYGHGIAYIGNDSVLVGGGLDPTTGKSIDDCEIINVKTGVVTQGPSLHVSRWTQFLTQQFPDTNDPCVIVTRVYAIGGTGGFSGTVDVIDSSLTSCEMIEFRHSSPSILRVPQPAFFTGTVCTGIDTSITILSSTCSEFHIDSAVVEGLSNLLLSTKLPDTVKNGNSKTFRLSMHSTSPGITSGLLRIFYNTGGSEQDTSIPITMNLKASTRGTIRSIVHDITGGDTVYVPIYLASNSGDQAQGFQLTAHYDTDLLTPIGPVFTGTLTDTGSLWDQHQISGGMNFLSYQPFSISGSKPVIILKFLTSVTKETCTSFVIDNFEVSFDSTGAGTDPCPLAVLSDSATICRTNECGDNSLRQFMVTGSVPELKAVYNPQSDKIDLKDGIDGPHDYQVINIMGRIVLAGIVSGCRNSIPAEALPSGIYIVRTSDGRRTYSHIVSIIK